MQFNPEQCVFLAPQNRKYPAQINRLNRLSAPFACPYRISLNFVHKIIITIFTTIQLCRLQCLSTPQTEKKPCFYRFTAVAS